MKPKADTDDGWFKVANDLMQAIAQARLTGAQHAVCAWLLCATYGRKTRFGKGKDDIEIHRDVEINHSQIARETGLHRALARRAVNSLLAMEVLHQPQSGRLGFNTRVGEWPLRAASEIRMGLVGVGPKTRARTPMGTDAHGHGSAKPDAPVRQRVDQSTPPPDARVRQKSSDGAPNARARMYGDVGEREKGRGAAGAAHPPSLHPGTAADTLRKRAQIADDRWPLEEHPAWRTASYELQAELREEWAVQENIRDTAKAKAQVQRAADEQARGEKKAVSPERARAIVNEFRSKHGGKT